MIYIIILKIVCNLENMSKLTEKLERLEDDLADYQAYVVKFIKYWDSTVTNFSELNTWYFNEYYKYIVIIYGIIRNDVFIDNVKNFESWAICFLF